jgi:hypothetical protein
VISPSRTVVMVRTTSSSKSMTRVPSFSGVIRVSALTRLVPYSCEDWPGSRLARSVQPMIVTPPSVT